MPLTVYSLTKALIRTLRDHPSPILAKLNKVLMKKVPCLSSKNLELMKDMKIYLQKGEMMTNFLLNFRNQKAAMSFKMLLP